jgi:PAS domain S-box-containing protein
LTNKPNQSALDSALSGGGAMGAMIRALNWSKTPLGPVESWPQSLRTAVSICLNSRFPVLIWWGSDLVKLYNDAYVQLIGSKHPTALGATGRSVWPEIWETIGPLLLGVMERAEANWADDLLLMLERNGYAEECYFTFSYSPIRDESGGVGGVFTPVVETTEKVIGERRMRTLRDLAATRSHRSRDTREACAIGAQELSSNPWDIPFAAVYLIDPDRGTAILTASVGNDPPLGLPATLDLRAQPWLAVARLMPGENLTLPIAEIGLSAPPPLCPWGDPVGTVIALPICCAKGGAPVGYLLSGVSPRKRLDTQYSSFFAQVADDFGEAAREALMVQREAALLAQQEAERTRLNDLFQQAPAGILMLHGSQHQVVLVNPGYLRLVGRRQQSDLLGKPICEALPEIVEQGFIQLLDEVYRTGKPFHGNEVMVHMNREESGQDGGGYFNFVYQPTRNGDNAIDGILVFGVEVTEQVLARREVEAREEQLRVLADSIPQLAWMSDARGDRFWYNNRWFEYTGTTLEEMRGWGWQSVHDPDQLPKIIESYQQSLATGAAFSMTYPLRGADGIYRNFLSLARPLRDASGTIVRWFGTNTDIDAEKKKEEALRQAEKLAVVGRLAASIAHEINNPLEAVTNLCFLARNAHSLEESQRYLEMADQELARVAQITSQTLRFHKQQSAAAATHVSELVETVLALHSGRISREGLILRSEVRPCRPLVCYSGEIRQVLANLIGNALDAMSNGGNLSVRVREATSWNETGSGIRITVADTGDGMTARTLERLYEPFFTTKEATGTGLGLWVSEEIVRRHGGAIRVRSCIEPSRRGTVFTVFLPYVILDGASNTTSE